MRRLFVLGDSISIQYGPYLKEMIEPRIQYDRKRGEAQALINLDTPAGANGGDSNRVVAYLREERDRGKQYDVLLVNCGLHDIKKQPLTGEMQVSLNQYRDNLDEIVRIGREMARSFIWVRTTDAVEEIHNKGEISFHRCHQDVLDYNAVADDLMRSYGISVLDLYSFTQLHGTSAYCDHVHYKEEVRRLQAAYIAGFLDSYLLPSSDD